MPVTPKYALRYPALIDPADVPTDMGKIAIDTENAIFGKAAGAELAYTEVTSNVNFSATSEATATTLVTAPSVTYDAADAIVEFYASAFQSATGTSPLIVLVLFRDGVAIGQIAALSISVSTGTANLTIPIRTVRKLTPGAGAHVFSVRAWLSPSGTATMIAQAGGPGAYVPAFIKVSRA